MDSFEAKTHVFIVRVWLEPRESTMSTPEWRGVIEHVPTQRRQYFKDLACIPAFIMPYLEEMGAQFGLCWRARRWLYRRKMGLMRKEG
jgi:hypothetical protein